MSTRKKTEIPFLGQPGPLPNLDLPSNADVIKSLKYLQVNKNVPIGKLISCPASKTDPSVMICSSSNCCLLDMIKQKWMLAGLPIMSDKSIKRKIEVLHGTHSSLRVTRPGPKVTSFIEEAPKLFDIGHSDLKDIIRKDTLRTSEAKEEDIAYYMAKVEGKYAKLDCSQDR